MVDKTIYRTSRESRVMLEKYALFKVLGALRNRDELSVRECARRASVGTGTSKTQLDWLAKTGIAKRRIIGRTHLYSIDVSKALARQYKILFSLHEISESKLVEELIERFSEISSIVLYGSAARGEDNDKSDIDILVVSRKKTRITGLKAERMLKRELTILSYSSQEWRDKARNDKVFYDRVMIDGLVLYGEMPVVN